MFDFHIHIHNDDKILKEIKDILIVNNQKLDTIMAEQSQLAADLQALQAQVVKSREEIIAKLAALEEAIQAADDVSPEVQAAFDELKAAVQTVDDIVPDPSEPTEPTEPQA